MKDLKTINIGTRPNSGDGDTVRDAFDKVNQNGETIEAEVKNLERMIDAKADSSKIPTRVSQLTNDSKYITLNEVPEPDLYKYATKEEVDGKIHKLSGETDNKISNLDVKVELSLATKADKKTTYTKNEVDGLIAEGGKVKTVNGKNPDSKGNITIDIPNPDLSEYAKSENVYTKTQTDDKIKSTSDNLKIDIDKKADKSTTYSKSEVDDKIANAPTKSANLSEVLAKGNKADNSIILGTTGGDYPEYSTTTSTSVKQTRYNGFTEFGGSNYNLITTSSNENAIFLEVPKFYSGYHNVTLQAKSGTLALLSDIQGGGGIPEAPVGSKVYGRSNSKWVQVPNEAPSDGKYYTRRNETWVEAPSGGGGGSIDPSTQNIAKVGDGYKLLTASLPDTMVLGKNSVYLSEKSVKKIAKTGVHSFSTGRSNRVDGNYSFSAGDTCDSLGYSSFTANSRNVASAKNSSAFGNNTFANTEDQFTCGRFSASGSNSLFTVGNGISISARKNAFAVMDNGICMSNAVIETIKSYPKALITKEYLEDYITSGSSGVPPTSTSTVSLESIVTFDSDLGSPNITKRQGLSILRMNVVVPEGTFNTETDVKIANIPDTFRPSTDFITTGQCFKGRVIPVRIKTNGDVLVISSKIKYDKELATTLMLDVNFFIDA